MTFLKSRNVGPSKKNIDLSSSKRIEACEPDNLTSEAPDAMGNDQSTCFCDGQDEKLKPNLLLECELDDSNHRNEMFPHIQCHPQFSESQSLKQQRSSPCTYDSTPSLASLPSLDATNNYAQQQECRAGWLRANGDEEIGDSTFSCVAKSAQKIQNEPNGVQGMAPVAFGDAPNGGGVVVSPRNSVFRGMKRRGRRLLDATSSSLAHVMACLEDFLFPRTNPDYRFSAKSNASAGNRGGVLLNGCSSVEEHHALMKNLLAAVKHLHSVEGLKALGLEYRLVRCEVHQVPEPPGNDCFVSKDCQFDNTVTMEAVKDYDFSGNKRLDLESLIANNGTTTMSRVSSRLDLASRISNFDDDEASLSEESDNSPEVCNFINDMPVAVSDVTNPEHAMCRCHMCMRMLCHIETGTIVDNANRRKYIADGDMYEVVSRLVQENAFDVVIEEGDLKWVTVSCADEAGGSQPIQALINSDHPLLLPQCERANSRMRHRPTFIICTGRGKVRAGIFSRQHLICDGMECSTCIPFVREAQARNCNVFIIDPNVNGEAHGFTSFQKTMMYWGNLCSQAGEDVCLDTYILSHSSSGGHLVRFLLDEEPKKSMLSYIKAIAFTDSTHNVQWAKSPEQKTLFGMLQSDRCVYFRCGKLQRDTAIDNQWHLHPAGQTIVTDSFWQHRFGTIKTMWAGTDEHSLTNWHAFAKIWEHFDYFMFGGSVAKQ